MLPGRPLRLTFFALALLAPLLAACRTERAPVSEFEPQPLAVEGAPRSYRLGFSSVPATLSDEAYLAAFDLAANFGDTLLMQRAPAWANFLPGASISDALRDSTLAERRAAEERELIVVLGLDPFDPVARERLQGLPVSHITRDLSDPDLRNAFIAEAVFIARNLRPDYLLLGTEVNATFERSPAAYQQFVSLYAEAYDAVKAVRPETLVFVSFQYEELLGVIPWQPPHAPRWELLDDFEGRLDLLAITTYPSFAFSVARKIEPRYYTQIRDHSDLPLAITSAGYSAAEGRDGMNSSTPAEQRRYLQRLLADADALGMELLIWFTARDLSFATAPPYDLIASIGLRDADDVPKEAWPAWVEAARRPYDPAAAELVRIAAERQAALDAAERQAVLDAAERQAVLDAAATPSPVPTEAGGG